MGYILKKIIVVILFVCILLSGCSYKNELAFPGEDNVQPYIQKAVGLGEVADFDYSPSIEEFFKIEIEGGMFGILNSHEDLKAAMSDEGLLADENCKIYTPIGQLFSICEGETRIYYTDESGNIDENRSHGFDSGDVSYLRLSEELANRVEEYINNPMWFQGSIRGKRIYTHFYMTNEGWLKAVEEKEPFKYLCLDVYIK